MSDYRIERRSCGLRWCARCWLGCPPSTSPLPCQWRCGCAG